MSGENAFQDSSDLFITSHCFLGLLSVTVAIPLNGKSSDENVAHEIERKNPGDGESGFMERPNHQVHNYALEVPCDTICPGRSLR